MKIRLNDAENPPLEFIVPEDAAEEIGKAGDVTFRGRSYRYSGVASGAITFMPSGPTVTLKEEWLSVRS